MKTQNQEGKMDVVVGSIDARELLSSSDLDSASPLSAPDLRLLIDRLNLRSLEIKSRVRSYVLAHRHHFAGVFSLSADLAASSDSLSRSLHHLLQLLSDSQPDREIVDLLREFAGGRKELQEKREALRFVKLLSDLADGIRVSREDLGEGKVKAAADRMRVLKKRLRIGSPEEKEEDEKVEVFRLLRSEWRTASTRFQDEIMNLPLAGIESILSSDTLQVASEDAVYDFLLKWARAQYPKVEERREILGSRLGRLVRFPYMTSRKLRKVLTCSDLDNGIASKAVLEALFFKAEMPHRQRAFASEESSSRHRFVERAYKYRPVKVVEFELPHPQCVVYLDLKMECANLFPSGRVYSQAFHLGGQGFFLSAHCNLDQQNQFHCFGLFLGMQEKGSATFTVDYEFAARTRPADDFVSKYKGYYTFTGGKAVGYRNLFALPWKNFLAEDSLYFIDGILHLRAELTIKQPKRPPALGVIY